MGKIIQRTREREMVARAKRRYEEAVAIEPSQWASLRYRMNQDVMYNRLALIAGQSKRRKR